MKTLILSDPHELVEQVDQLRKTVPHDRCVCLGDWFDDWKSPAERLKRTLEYVQANPEIENLLGNHDVPYFFNQEPLSYPDFYCPGYTKDRGALALRLLRSWSRSNLRLHMWVDGWLLSHAGVHPYLLRAAPSEAEHREVIDYACAEALRALHRRKRHFMTGRGADRAGNEQQIGGINWLDWNSFQAIPGLNQIVGHTYGKEPRQKILPGRSVNFCIDTGFHHFAVITDGRLEVFQTEDFIGTWHRRKTA